MNSHKQNVATAIVVMAVLSVGLLFSGCATKRDVNEINARLANMERANESSRDMIARMDSLITASTEADRRLQNDIRASSDELATQISQLLENYNDLLMRIEQMGQQKVTVLSPSSSPGAQGGPSGGGDEAPPSRTPEVNCINAYDTAFTVLRAGEYEEAIGLFHAYQEACPDDENVENTYYWIGECYYSMQKYTEAIVEYDKIVSGNPESLQLRRALYKLGRCKQETNKNDEAKSIFERLVNEFAGTLEAEQAAERLKDL